MSTREILRDEWAAFLDAFSRVHHGWLSTVEVQEPRAAPCVLVREQPLAGVTAEARNGESATISVLTGSSPSQHVEHRIGAVAHVRVSESETGVEQALEVESKGGQTLRPTFRSVVSPELIDGFVLD